MVVPDSIPEEIGDDKPVAFFEDEEGKRRFEAGLEAALRVKAGAQFVGSTESLPPSLPEDPRF